LLKSRRHPHYLTRDIHSSHISERSAVTAACHSHVLYAAHSQVPSQLMQAASWPLTGGFIEKLARSRGRFVGGAKIVG